MDQTYLETASGLPDAASTEPILAWRVHLLRENPARMFLIAPIVVISLLVCCSVIHSLLFTAIILFLFVSALSEYLFPIRFEITNRGASARSLLGKTFIEWDRVKKYYVDNKGIKLSPLSRQGRLEAYRGVYLRFGDRRDEVVEAVRGMRDAVQSRERADK